jgi:hypothetical protein
MTDTDRLAALLHEATCLGRTKHWTHGRDEPSDIETRLAARLIAAGVTFGRKWGVGVDIANGEAVTVVCERLADGKYRIVRPAEDDDIHPGHVCFDHARYDGLRDWWDGLDDDEKREAYLVEKGNADALAATPAPLDVERLARAVVNGAEADEDFDGQFIDYLVSYELIDALRAALAAAYAEEAES